MLKLTTFRKRRRSNNSSFRVVSRVGFNVVFSDAFKDVSRDVDVKSEVKVGHRTFEKVIRVVGVKDGPVGLRQVAVQDLAGACGLSNIH